MAAMDVFDGGTAVLDLDYYFDLAGNITDIDDIGLGIRGRNNPGQACIMALLPSDPSNPNEARFAIEPPRAGVRPGALREPAAR